MIKRFKNLTEGAKEIVIQNLGNETIEDIETSLSANFVALTVAGEIKRELEEEQCDNYIMGEYVEEGYYKDYNEALIYVNSWTFPIEIRKDNLINDMTKAIKELDIDNQNDVEFLFRANEDILNRVAIDNGFTTSEASEILEKEELV